METVASKLLLVALIGCTSVFWATGCHYPGAYEGENGDIAFENDTATPYSTPVMAEGGELVLEASKCNGCASLEVTTATSTDPSVFEVVAIDDSFVTLLAHQAGTAKLEVDASDDGGDGYADTLPVEVQRPARQVIHHSCTQQPMAYYQADTEYRLEREIYGPDDDRLVGDGLTLVEADGDAVDVHPELSTASELVVRTGGSGTSGTLRSTLGDTELQFGVARLADADGISHSRLIFSDEPFEKGGVDGVGVHPTIENSPLCGYDFPMHAEIQTPQNCTMLNLDGEEQPEAVDLDSNGFLIRADAVGECRVEVRFERDGEPLTGTVALEIQPPTDE